MVIGDRVGHGTICGRYKSYSNKIIHPIRSCDVSQGDIDNPDHFCSYTEEAPFHEVLEECVFNIGKCQEVVKHNKMAASLSQALVISTFFDVSCGGDKHGIFGMTLFEILYTLFLELMKYSLHSIFEYESSKEIECYLSFQMKGLNTVEFEKRMRMLSPLSKHQSDWFMPRASFNMGVTALAGI